MKRAKPTRNGSNLSVIQIQWPFPAGILSAGEYQAAHVLPLVQEVMGYLQSDGYAVYDQ